MKLSIGQRVTISKQDNETIIKINGEIEPWMNHALMGWVFMWTLLGAYMLYYILSGKAVGDSLFFFVTYLIFWLYFELKAVYSMLFRMYGYELVKLNKDELYIKRAVFSYGKVNRYDRENIKNLRKVEHDRKSINGAFNKSFWVVGNEQIVFDFMGSQVGIGMHLEEKDRNELLVQMRRFLKRK